MSSTVAGCMLAPTTTGPPAFVTSCARIRPGSERVACCLSLSRSVASTASSAIQRGWYCRPPEAFNRSVGSCPA